MITALVGFAHLVAVGVALTALLLRGVALRGVVDAEKRSMALLFDTLSGLAAATMIGTGLWRLLGGLAKPTAWYLDNDAFWLKMGLLALLLLLETAPMAILIQWRVAAVRARLLRAPVDPGALWAADGVLVRRLSFLESAIGVFIALTASAMARGVGMQLIGG
jgi:putative membrane protein